MPRYAVTLHANISITADDRDEAVRYCDEDAREFVVQNDMLDIGGVKEVDAASVDPTGSLEEIEFRTSEVVRSAEPGSVDWILRGVYVVVVDAADPASAEEAAKATPKRLADQALSPSV